MTRVIAWIAAPAAVAAILAPAAAVAAPQPRAAAASRCGDTYRVRRGDTLRSIARRCGTSARAIAEANWRIGDIDRIRVGWRLRMPAGARGGDDRRGPPHWRARDRQYRVRAGDTLYSIASRFRVGLGALISANAGIDPHRLAVGDLIRIPGRGGRGGDGWRQRRGDQGRWDGHRRGHDGRDHDRWDHGRWNDGRRDHDRRGHDGRGDDGRNRRGGVAVTGTLTREGVECPALRSDDGRLYTLAGGSGRYGPGDRVRVRGSLAQMSFCQQGRTIEVERIESARR